MMTGWRLLALDLAADLDAGKQRQIQVEQDDFKRSHAAKKLTPCDPSGGFDDLKSLASQELCDQTAKEMFVLDQ